MSVMVEAKRLGFAYPGGKTVLEDVSLTITAGQSLGIVGESGSGKTTLLRLLLGLIRPSQGEIRFKGERLEPRDGGFMRRYRAQVQVVFQDPYSSLDPRQKISAIVSEPLRSLAIAGDHGQMVTTALASVGLQTDIGNRYPHEFSGGQRQRIAIARAIVARPDLLLADEAVSALDLSTRIRIVELFKSLSQEMTLAFVSHDLGAVAAVCSQIVILEKGRIVEAGATGDILARPSHPYTQRLLASVPRMPR